MMKIPEKESLEVEFKSDRKCYPDQELVEEIVGMTNTAGGDLYLGVEDDGKVTGLHPSHKDVPGLQALIRNRTIPSVQVTSSLLKDSDQNLDVMLIQIPLSRQIIATSDGKTLRRQLKADGSPEIVPFFPFEMETRLSDLNALDFTAQPIFEASVEDFDPVEVQRLRNLVSSFHGDPSLITLDDEALFRSLGMVKQVENKLVPTYVGLLLVGKKEKLKELMPTAESGFQILDGRIVRKNDYHHHPILSVFEEYMQIFQANNTEQETEKGMQRIPIPEYSQAAFREALINAFVHRDYTKMGPVLVMMNQEGITISSRGAFIQGVTLDNLLQVSPGGRNPALADALKRIGLTERTCRGVARIFEGSILYGRPLPDYTESSSEEVRIFIPKAKPDLPFFFMLRDEPIFSSSTLTINDLMILSFLRQNPAGLSRSKLRDLLHISETRVAAAIEHLESYDLLAKSGSIYRLNPRKYKKTPEKSKIDENTFEKAVLDYLKDHDSITRKTTAEVTGLSVSQAYRLLIRMTDMKELERIGSGPSTSYRISPGFTC